MLKRRSGAGRHCALMGSARIREVVMTLYEAQKGNSYCIQGLYVEPAITRRLEALGLNDGTIVNVLNRKRRGALIIRVRGTRLALGKHISSNIEICEWEEKESRREPGSEEKAKESRREPGAEEKAVLAQGDRGDAHEK